MVAEAKLVACQYAKEQKGAKEEVKDRKPLGEAVRRAEDLRKEVSRYSHEKYRTKVDEIIEAEMEL